MTLVVEAPGLLTTVQDLGRLGVRASGVPPSGAMDRWGAALANRLVGNADGAPLLELTLTGPALLAEAPCRVAALGGRGVLRAAGRALRWREVARLETGERLEIGPLGGVARAYLAFAGGLVVPTVLGSASTYLRGGFGGCSGRALVRGDRLAIGATHGPPAASAPPLDPLPTLRCLRALRGPQWDDFDDDSRRALLETEWRLSPQSDRVGLRLTGARLACRDGHEIRPEGLVPGAIQVPASGEPIVLGPDLPTTGSYAKIATVIGADRGALAYLLPGEAIRFRLCDLDEARAAWRERVAELDRFGSSARRGLR